jgi:hypothetical protein
MKTTRRRPAPSNCRSEDDDNSASLVGAGELRADAYVVPGLKTKHGWRAGAWGKRQYAVAALRVLYPGALPTGITLAQLTRDVNATLARDPKYCATKFGELKRLTILRAAKAAGLLP